MLNLDPAKLVVIFVIALIVMGPERLPSFARQLGHAWKTVTSYRDQAEEEIRKAIPNFDIPAIPKNPSAMVTGFISDLVNPTAKGTSVASEETREDAGSEGMTVLRQESLVAKAQTEVETFAYSSKRSRDADHSLVDPGMN